MIVYHAGNDKDSLAGPVHEVAGSSPVGGTTGALSLTRYVTGTPNKRAIASSSSSCQRVIPRQR